VQGEGDAVECSPNDEIPGGTVSESSEEHGLYDLYVRWRLDKRYMNLGWVLQGLIKNNGNLTG